MFKWVADDEATARKIAYGYGKDSMLCVTLKGDKYSPQGTLEGGHKEGHSLLKQNEIFRSFMQKKTELLQAKENLDR